MDTSLKPLALYVSKDGEVLDGISSLVIFHSRGTIQIYKRSHVLPQSCYLNHAPDP